jgi:putative transposase
MLRWIFLPIHVQGEPPYACNEAIRRWLHELGWVWRRVHLVAKDDDPQCIERFGLIRFHHDDLGKRERLVVADELDIHLLPKVGAQWMPQGSRLEVMTPGKNEKHYVAGTLETLTGEIHYTLGNRKNHGLFRDLLDMRDHTSPASRIDRMYVVVDHYIIHKAKVVQQWLEKHPRFELLWLPTYCPKANPIERAFGDVHDTCTRNHQRQRLRDLVHAVEHHLKTNGPWKYKMSRLYDEPDVLAEVERLAAQQQPQAAA